MTRAELLSETPDGVPFDGAEPIGVSVRAAAYGGRRLPVRYDLAGADEESACGFPTHPAPPLESAVAAGRMSG